MQQSNEKVTISSQPASGTERLMMTDFAAAWPMQLPYLLVFLQRSFPACPRLTFVSASPTFPVAASCAG